MSDAGDWHWRNTMRPARFFAIDSRAALAVILVLVHFRLWTFVLGCLTMIGFWLAERAGYDFDAVLRRGRSFVIGPKRPAVVFGSKRRLKDYGR